MIRNATLILAVLGAVFSPVFAQDQWHMDPKQVVGPDRCGECHKSEMAAWKTTVHHKSFFQLTQSEDARDIAEKMGVSRIKRESLCMQCHFTSTLQESVVTPIAGTSCESCHGAALDWIDLHNDYGGKDVKKEDETQAHREQRLAASRKAGMIRPESLYDVASNCYQCHTVPNETLINTGGHRLGSNFELVAYSQGEVRHQFMRSGDGKTNMASTPESLRLMYVIGQALELEYSLKGLAEATVKDKYALAMAKRVKRAQQSLAAIHQAVPHESLQSLSDLAASASLKLNNRQPLLALAQQVQDLAKTLQKSLSSQDLSALDSLLPQPQDYRGTALAR
jgi:hypothetical protein